MSATKVFVSRDLTTLPAAGIPGDWTFSTMADLGAAEFAQLMVRAAEGDPFDISTPESAEDDLRELVEDAGSAFDPTRWLVVRDRDGDLGVVLPQPTPGSPAEGMLYYLAVMPERRGHGVGRLLHAFGLRLLRDAGVTKYAGSTDQRNVAMVRIFAANGCTVTHTKDF